MAGVEVSGNPELELQQRLQKINTEIEQIGGINEIDDEVEIEGCLDGKFAEFLLKPENVNQYRILKEHVDKLKNGDWSNLGDKAGKGLDDLATFLDDIGNKDRMKKDYDEFMKKIQMPKKLNTMKSWEIRRLNIYLGFNKDEALVAYNAMKPIVGKFDENKMKSEDIRFFESIWNTLQSNYSNSDKFMENDYPEVKSLQPTVDSLKAFAGSNWDGTNNISIPEVKNSIINKEKVKVKFEEMNNKRTRSNEEKINNINVTVDDLTKFTKKDGLLKYDGQEFTVEKMMELFGDKIKEQAKQGTNFVNDGERDIAISKSKGNIFNKMKENLLKDKGVKEETSNNGNEGNESINGKFMYEPNKEDFRIKLNGLKDKIKELGFYDGNEEGNTLKFDINKVKEYLVGIQGESWRNLQKQGPLEKATWIVAVQIALNYLGEKEGKSSYNVKWIDGIYKDKTKAGVRGFQEDNELLGRDGKGDGKPGPKTIEKIVERIGGSSN